MVQAGIADGGCSCCEFKQNVKDLLQETRGTLNLGSTKSRSLKSLLQKSVTTEGQDKPPKQWSKKRMTVGGSIQKGITNRNRMAVVSNMLG